MWPNNTVQAQVLGSDVALNVANSFFNGPTTGSIGANGQKWLILGNYCVSHTNAGNEYFTAHLWNGAAIIGGEQVISSVGSTDNVAGSMFGVASLTAATTFTLRAKCTDTGGLTGKLIGNGSSIQAIRLT
jgi:hypothetical protein